MMKSRENDLPAVSRLLFKSWRSQGMGLARQLIQTSTDPVFVRFYQTFPILFRHSLEEVVLSKDGLREGVLSLSYSRGRLHHEISFGDKGKFRS